VGAAPQRHRLDRRAGEIAKAGEGDGDDLLTTPEVAKWLGVSRQWVEIGRGKGRGPPFVRLAPTRVRYKRSAVLAWLEARQTAADRT